MSFENAYYWKKDLDIGTREGIALALVGNKCDLNSARQVEMSRGQVSE